jgi:hypothetical protein
MSEQNSCKYCEQSFKSERTLSAHICVKKRRMLDKDSIGSQLGFRVFQRFYELTTNTKKPKNLEDFISSKYYSSFVKFARHLVDLNPVDCNSFVDFVISNGIPLNQWHHDEVYLKFLKTHIENEHTDRAVERTILFIDEWSKDNKKTINEFFEQISPIEASFMIRSGRLSPWVLYLSAKGASLLSRFNEEQMAIIKGIIDPVLWKGKFMAKQDDVRFVKNLLRTADI